MAGVIAAAAWPRPDTLEERLLVIDPHHETLKDAQIRDLPRMLLPGDVLVVNDAATLPASLHTADRGLEVRLLARRSSDAEWLALLLGPGDHRVPTEARPPPRRLELGELLMFSDELSARVSAIDPETPRVFELRFDRIGGELFRLLYELGRPVQYAYVATPLELWHVQSTFSARPWALEMPSAGRPLSFRLLADLKRRGVELGSLTHAAGLSSTGSELVDRRLPLDEHYALPERTCDLIGAAKRRGGRIVAVGTTVVRALESCALHGAGKLEPGDGLATLRLGPGYRPQIVDGMLTGIHPPGSSHFALLEALAPKALLEAALEHAGRAGYLQHEFGDSCLILPQTA
jgi:S-adenosylmethionine:tRNA ribosyltransferase-isomerase